MIYSGEEFASSGALCNIGERVLIDFTPNIVKDKHGNWRNLEYKFAIECSVSWLNIYDGSGWYWWVYSKYKTQRAMLQALKQLKENELNRKGRMNKSFDGGKTYHESNWYFRPIHLNYDIH